MNYPKVLAAPENGKVRTLNEIPEDEDLDFTRVRNGEGREKRSRGGNMRLGWRERRKGTISDEQGGCRRGKSCVNQIFAIKMLVEEYLGMDRKLYAVFMNSEKAYDKVDREALWYVLKIYDVGGQLMEGIKVSYREANGCVKVDGELSDTFAVGVEVKQGCVMSPWLFNILMDGYTREMKAKVGKVGARLKLNGVDWSVAACLFVDNRLCVTGRV